MNADRFQALTSAYSKLRVVVLGDYCLDRYLEIDPALQEVSIETGLPVHNVTRVRAQPGAAGTILNNLVALGVGDILPIGFSGDDGEGFELRRALSSMNGVRMDHFLMSAERRTFTYCKPLVLEKGRAPVELNRLDSKNWTPTPGILEDQIASHLRQATATADAVIVLDQVDKADTGVVTKRVLAELAKIQASRPGLLILADSRRGLADFPMVTFKMNAAELAALTQTKAALSLENIHETAAGLARKNGRAVFVSLSERGILGAARDGKTEHVPILPIRGEIDIVGAGDAVSANLAAALGAGATLRESLELANAAASVVIHKLGTTGTASVSELCGLLL
jgi:rfaE bifunctional protein kinase chain/domain